MNAVRELLEVRSPAEERVKFATEDWRVAELEGDADGSAAFNYFLGRISGAIFPECDRDKLPDTIARIIEDSVEYGTRGGSGAPSFKKRQEQERMRQISAQPEKLVGTEAGQIFRQDRETAAGEDVRAHLRGEKI